MAIVPISRGNLVERRPIAGVHVQPAQQGSFGQQLGQGMTALGDTAAQALSAEDRLQGEMTQLVVKDADNAFADLISQAIEDPETGYRHRQGRAAVESFDDAWRGIQDAREQVRKDMPPGPAGEAFDRVASQRMVAARTIMGRHFSAQREVWKDETSDARIRIAASDAGNAYQDPAQSEQFLATAVQELASVAERRGWSDETLANRIQRTVSSTRRDVASRLLGQVSPDVADQYLDTFRGQFSSDDAAFVEASIRRERAAIAAEERRIRNEQRAEENRIRQEARQIAREHREDLTEQARDVIGMMERGHTVDQDSVETLASALVEADRPTLAVQLRTTAATQTFVAEKRQQRPDQLQGWINQTRARTRGGTSPEQHAQIEAAERLLGQMTSGLREDPLSWAVQAGVATLDAVDLSDAGSVSKRVQTALGVARHYGMANPVFLTDEETAILANNIQRANAQQRSQMAGNIARHFGRHSRDVLATISNSDPVFAHAAGLASMGGYHADTARRVFVGQEALANRSVSIPADARFEEAFQPLGNVMFMTPRTRGAVVEAAKAIYAGAAAQQGLDPAKVDANAWGIAINRAVGARYVNGQRMGGFDVYRGLHVVLPTNVQPGEMGRLMSGLTDDDLRSLGPLPRYSNGRPADAAAVRGAFLIDAGTGRYYLSATRDGSQLLRGGRGPYVLDLGRLAPRLRGRTPRQVRPMPVRRATD